jgi:hypothetical protein
MEQTDLFGNIQAPPQQDKHISGYRIYNKEVEKKTVRNDLPNLYPDLPDKRYTIIYCDPIWDYGGKMQFDKSGKKEENKNGSSMI